MLLAALGKESAVVQLEEVAALLGSQKLAASGYGQCDRISLVCKGDGY